MSSPTNIVEQVREQFGQLLGRFETAWEDGAEPEISDFLFLEPIEDQAVRYQLLLELVKLDLSSRWKQMLPKGGGEVPASQDCHLSNNRRKQVKGFKLFAEGFQ